jgi:hypothetical protein
MSQKSVQWEPSCSTRTDGQTDMTKLIAAFRNFVKAPKHPTLCPQSVFMCLYDLHNKVRLFLY